MIKNILYNSVAVSAFIAVGVFTGCSKKTIDVPDNSIATVSAFVGNPTNGPLDGTGAAAYFDRPIGMAFDAAGILYVVDSENAKIRKVTPAGVVTSFTGNGTHNVTDGSPLTATFNAPYCIIVDALGNSYVSEGSHIRKITPDGVVSTFITNMGRPGNMTMDAAGNIYVSDFAYNAIYKITPAGVRSLYAGGGGTGADNGAANIATFNSPGGLAFDASGNLYVSDSGNNMIRKITPAGMVSTFAGTGKTGTSNGPGATATFNFPEGIVVDAVGNIIVADKINHLVRIISPAGIVSTLAGSGGAGSVNGSGSIATFFQPLQLAIDKQGVLYITDTTNQIRKITYKK
ncbi:hypothetical protein KXQ82_11850 [Mucilaginibacter sp. HMF5004]|uniref:SMP-30/gluconolactonase/LRE family protein n=1 Tax=Mucilaginibacter rivuli TaxID=2857527 RepID=UPI001C5E04A8|nr:SMP-30/gluconolactonase/LRE family protein [Mucilaginibacter rivuli]MBW4890418.1 hypothetical protein [Mucilaginibacter rivuli]